MKKIIFNKGESTSIGFLFNSEYDMSRIQSCSAWLGSKRFPLATIGQMLRMEISSNESHKLGGIYKLFLWIDDVNLGVKEIQIADVCILLNNANDSNQSVSTGYDFTFYIAINDTQILVGDAMYNYVKGIDGKDGIDGADGKSAYQQAVEGGYTGTIEQFTNDLLTISTKANQSTEEVIDPATNEFTIADVHLAAYASLASNADSAGYADIATFDSQGNQIDTHYATQAELQAVEDGVAGKENTGVAQTLITQLIDGATDNTLKKLQDKITAINAIIGGSAPDGDNIVNTVAELLAVFSTFPEGSDMVTLLTAKLNTSDVYNALDQLLAGKALDARQGKVLKDLCDGLRTDLTNHNHNGTYEPANANIQEHISTTGNPHGTKLTDLPTETLTQTTPIDTDSVITKVGTTIKASTFSSIYTYIKDKLLAANHTFTQLITFSGGVKLTKIIPQSDAAGVLIRNAADTADVVKVDTENKNVGINCNPTAPLTVDITGDNGTRRGLRLFSSGQYSEIFFNVSNRSGNVTNDGDLAFGLQNAANGFAYLYNRMAGAILFGTNNTARMNIGANGGIRIGDSTAPRSAIDVNGGVQIADDTAAASATKEGTIRYRKIANNSYVEMCMQTGATTYAWVVIKQITW